MLRWIAAASALILCLAGCAAANLDPRYVTAAHLAFDEVLRAAPQNPGPHFASDLKTDQAYRQIAALQDVMPKQPPKARRLIGSNYFTTVGKGTAANLSEEYDYGDKLALVNTYLYWPAQGVWELRGFHFDIADRAALKQNDFSLIGKSPFQYAFLLMVVLTPILMIMAAIKVVRTKGLKRKWLWFILSFFGLMFLQMNWATGQVAVDWISFRIFSVGAARGLSSFSAWVLITTTPVGALLILSGIWANPARARKRGGSSSPVDPAAFDS